MKNLKLITTILVLAFTFIADHSMAQPGGKPLPKEKKEKIEQLKIAFITKELDLTSEEAEKFWPVYNEMSDKLSEKRKAGKKLNKELRDNFDTLTEDEIKTKSEAILDNEIEQVKLKKEYHAKIAEVIGYKKATKLLSLEQRFKRELLQQMKKPEHPPVENRPAPKAVD